METVKTIKRKIESMFCELTFIFTMNGPCGILYTTQHRWMGGCFLRRGAHAVLLLPSSKIKTKIMQ